MLLKYKKCTNCETYYDPTLQKCPKCHKLNELYLNRAISNDVAFMHPIAQIGLFLGGFALAGMLVIELITALFFRNFITNKIALNAAVLSATYFLMLTGLASIILFTRRNYFFSKYKRGMDYFYGLIYAITLVLIGSLIGNFITIFYHVSDNVNQTAASEFSHYYPILALFVIGIVGPICEELTYRVGLYSFFRRIDKWLALAITAIVFALIHFDFEAEDLVNELWSLPSYIAAGIILTLAYEHRGPACSMTAHVLYNIFAFLVMMAS